VYRRKEAKPLKEVGIVLTHCVMVVPFAFLSRFPAVDSIDVNLVRTFISVADRGFKGTKS
jgi:hypothetical protein